MAQDTPLIGCRDPLGSQAPTWRTRGFTQVELLCTLIAVGLLAVVAFGAFQVMRPPASTAPSIYRLARISQANACYAADWNDRQFTLVPDDFGHASGCEDYIQNYNCLPSPILGWNTESGSNALWAYWIDYEGLCVFGVCSNTTVIRPIDFDANGMGAWRVPNVRGLREYLAAPTGFYRRDWYVAGGPSMPPAEYKDMTDEFRYDGTLWLSTYCSSPAAMFDPGVFRKPSEGGFQDPSEYVEAYRSPVVSRAMYPELKTRMLEHDWLRGAPTRYNPNAEELRTPWYFNQSIAAQPVTLFFDGSIDTLLTGEAYLDDLKVRESTGGVDGLWSQDTPFGEEGYFGQFSEEGLSVSHHVLTTDGIRGRDLLGR